MMQMLQQKGVVKSKQSNLPVRYFLLESMLMISQNSSISKSDGFPLVLVFFDIVNKAVGLLKQLKKRQNQTKFQRRLVKEMEADQERFGIVCEVFFNNNVLSCFNEFVFHYMINFLVAWRYGIQKQESMFNFIQQQFYL